MKPLKDGKETSVSQSKSERPRVLVDARDLEVILSAGAVIQGRLNDLISLRDQIIGKDPRFHVIYWCNSNVRLYVVNEDDYMLLKKIKEGLEK
jgi:hypothetical protein